jgi:glutamine amidotransferase PdxT
VLASAFHPELTDDPRFHALFMAMISKAEDRQRAKGVAQG